MCIWVYKFRIWELNIKKDLLLNGEDPKKFRRETSNKERRKQKKKKLCNECIGKQQWYLNTLYYQTLIQRLIYFYISHPITLPIYHIYHIILLSLSILKCILNLNIRQHYSVTKTWVLRGKEKKYACLHGYVNICSTVRFLFLTDHR